MRIRDRETKRSRTDLYAQVLEVLIRYPEGGKITRISYGVGVPVDRLRTIIEALSNYGLARKCMTDEQNLYFVTPRGLEFLDIYWKMKGFLEIFGEKQP
ncbi:MAG: winged helix-turn-helix domain-containing protein [Candidatus Bathyarchaeia archaeon]|jgi:predicted transcriptional regulator